MVHASQTGRQKQVAKLKEREREREEAGLKYQSRGGGPCCLAPLKKVVS